MNWRSSDKQGGLKKCSHSPWAMKRNVEREKEEVLVRLIYKKT
jgi:hypothetical protein